MKEMLDRRNPWRGVRLLCALLMVLGLVCSSFAFQSDNTVWRVPVSDAMAEETALADSQEDAAEATSSDEIVYVENAWNFVEEAMDVSQGIPDYAIGVLAKIRDRGVLRVATEPYFPPQEFLDESKSGQEAIVGSDIEMAKLIAERMGVTLEMIPLDFSDVLPAVAEGTADLAISALSYTPGRASGYEMSKGYHFAPESAGSGMIIRVENAEKYTNLNDFSDQIILAQAGSLQEALLAAEIREYLEFRRLGTAQAVYDAVMDGTAAAGVVDIESAEIYIDAHPEAGLMIMPAVRFQLSEAMDGDRVAAKKGEIQLMYFVNGVINELLESGQYEAWYQAYQNYGGAK